MALRAVVTVVVLLARLAGCAATRQRELQETVRRAARVSVADSKDEVGAVFRELATSGGLDPTQVYVAVENSETLNAASIGKRHFYVTRAVIEAEDVCFLTGIAAHEVAHEILKHPESIATTSDITNAVTTVIGTAAGFFVPGIGYVISGVASIGLNAYSRTQESEADALAVKLLRDAGKPEWSLRYALEVLQRESRGRRSATWLSTHPAIADRIAAQPAADVEEIRRVCGSAPRDPPAWCRGERDRWDGATAACHTAAS